MIISTKPHNDCISVLLVDDNRMFLHVLSELINQHPKLIVVGIAGTGEQAFEAAQKLRPQVIVFDRDMQVFSNPYAISYLRTKSPGAILIGLTMIEEEESVISEAACGADLILKKSHVSSQLIPWINALVQPNMRETAPTVAATCGMTRP
jgi:DNA-binding NarL/FixJ family response regulator